MEHFNDINFVFDHNKESFREAIGVSEEEYDDLLMFVVKNGEAYYNAHKDEILNIAEQIDKKVSSFDGEAMKMSEFFEVVYNECNGDALMTFFVGLPVILGL